MITNEYNTRAISFSQCTGCEACGSICPRNAIKMEEDKEGFYYPIVKESLCIDCGLCDKVCPILNQSEKKNTIFPPVLFSAYEKDLQFQNLCSSGGVFGLISEIFLENNGYVFGAAFDSNLQEVKHVSNLDVDIKRIYRSKYVQSTIGDTYKNVYELLENEKMVLFCGCPCQVEGLKSFLQKEYENLLTIDFVCHGVPSPGIFKAMLKNEQDKQGKKIKDITFREKNEKDVSKQKLKIYFDDNSFKVYDSLDHYYYQLFLNNAILRKSCMTCARPKNHKSDLTLADDWLQNWVNDKKLGISLITINTDKGNTFFEKIKDKLVSQKINFKDRQQLFKPHNYSFKNRDLLFLRYNKSKSIKILKKISNHIITKNLIKQNAINYVSRFLKAIRLRKESHGK